mgnify:CR=1 FL=1
MKREIMSTKRYEEVLDMLETDKKAIEKLSSSERQEIIRDGYAMKIAAATDITNLRHLPKVLRQDKSFMCSIIKDFPLAMSYCYKTWFQNKNFVEFVKDVTNAEAKKYNSPEMKELYNELVNIQAQKAKNIGIEK